MTQTVIREKKVLSPSEQRVMRRFRKFRMTAGQMLCFYGTDLKQNAPALDRLTQRELLVKESFKGAYSLTQAGFAAMKKCRPSPRP